MSSSEVDELDRAALGAPLAGMPSWLSRARSCVLREAVARLVAPSIVFVRGRRRGGRKRVALTFDDGPSAATRRCLDVLADLDVRATFFLVGENAARRPDLVAEYTRRGHDVGSHGWSHEDFRALGASRLTEELGRTWAFIPSGRDAIRLVRPPRGALSPRILLKLATSGYVTVLWSVDSDDCRTRDPVAIARRLSPRRVRSGDVVLLHETQPWTMRALGPVVRALRAAEYEFATITDLIRRDDELAGCGPLRAG
ncbi:MAG TPA: polysaccharide deacetylase family protein [Polyangiaceae bacterium]|nr:polysaccharide deacetylase family protein [Polyangiaceae bacterium]